MTNHNLFLVGKLGKPHSLKGYQYINIEYFFRNFDLKKTQFLIDGKNFVVEDFKTHLKNRNLIKFYSYDSIESINKLRNKTVKISSDETNLFINEEKLPWPGFFIGHELKKDNYNLESNGIEMSVPYNSNFFTFNDGELSLLDSSLTV